MWFLEAVIRQRMKSCSTELDVRKINKTKREKNWREWVRGIDETDEEKKCFKRNYRGERFFCEGESKLFLLTVQFHEKKNYFFPKEKVSENIDGVEMISFNSL